MHLKPASLNNTLLFSTMPMALSYILTSPWQPIKREVKLSLEYPENSLLNFTELTAKYGYASEEHKVITDDGYILTMFRIVKAKHCVGAVREPPILLMHGLLQSSDSWIDSGPNSGLAYLISDECYDLWLGNNRGNYYSRLHVRLDPDKDPEFWNFDFDLMGTYDNPALIDHVLRYTKSNKLNYIGFSQGTGAFLVMCSKRPDYCDKAQLVIGLAPAARLMNTKSKFFRGLLESIETQVSALPGLGYQEVLAKGSDIQEFLELFCHAADLNRGLCELMIHVLDHVDTFHWGSISNETIKVLVRHFPAGTSLLNMARYGQSIKNDRFVNFDFGKKRNLVVYGSELPPVYNLTAVTVPVVYIYGRNDGLVDSEDVKWLVSQLPNVLESIEVEDPLWTHLDVTYSQYTGKEIFPKIKEYLSKYSYA